MLWFGHFMLLRIDTWQSWLELGAISLTDFYQKWANLEIIVDFQLIPSWPTRTSRTTSRTRRWSRWTSSSESCDPRSAQSAKHSPLFINKAPQNLQLFPNQPNHISPISASLWNAVHRLKFDFYVNFYQPQNLSNDAIPFLSISSPRRHMINPSKW